MKKAVLLYLLLSLGCVLCPAQGVVYASRLLERMARTMLLTDTIGRSGEGTARLSYGGLPVIVEKSNGRVMNIGYSLFTDKQREDIGTIRSRFIERFLLTTDLPWERVKSVEEEMMEEKIMFRMGSLATLKSLLKDTACTVEASLLKERLHAVRWKKGDRTVCEIEFPANHELLLGIDMLEIDERLQMDILKTPAHPKDPNDLNDLKDLTPYTLQITQKQYNYRQATFTVPLVQWLCYCREQGCEPQFSIISENKTADGGVYLDALLIMHSAYLGCAHVMRMQIPKEGDSKTVTARLNAFVPTANIKDLYYDGKQ